MSRLLAGAVAIVALAACGGGTSTKPPRMTSNAPPPTTAATAPARTPSYPQTTSHTSTAGASNVRLPAEFTIGPGDRLSPPSVTSPAGVLIGLTLISGDGKVHRVSVGSRTLLVPAGGRTYTALQGLHTGRYPVIVDGVLRGVLVVGGKVGP